MNIIVFGIGGVGGYFGGLLAHHKRAHPEWDHAVNFIARGEHLERIRRDGLLLRTDGAERVCRPDRATDKPADCGAPDLVLLCVKSYDLPDAAAALDAIAEDGTVVLPLLNGVDVPDRIRAVTGKLNILPACVYVGTHIESPGVVVQKGGSGRILCGPDPRRPDERPDAVVTALSQAGIAVEWLADPYPAIWGKFLFIAAYGLVTAVSHKSLGEAHDDAVLSGRVRGAMDEIAVIAKRKGIALPDDAVASAFERARSFPSEARTSFQRDVETPGRKNEADLFAGTILRLGAETGTPTPFVRSLHDELNDAGLVAE